MAEFKKSYGIVLALLAFALTFMGLVLAATDQNPSGIPKDTLTLHGVPPHSASVLVTVSNGQSYDVSATINVNFDTSRAEALMEFPLLFTQTSVEFRLVGDHVYAEAADISSGKWLEINEHPPSFFGIALELTQPGPDLQLIKGFDHVTTTKNGYATTWNFVEDPSRADQRTELTAQDRPGIARRDRDDRRERRGDRREHDRARATRHEQDHRASPLLQQANDRSSRRRRAT